MAHSEGVFGKKSEGVFGKKSEGVRDVADGLGCRREVKLPEYPWRGINSQRGSPRGVREGATKFGRSTYLGWELLPSGRHYDQLTIGRKSV